MGTEAAAGHPPEVRRPSGQVVTLSGEEAAVAEVIDTLAAFDAAAAGKSWEDLRDHASVSEQHRMYVAARPSQGSTSRV